LGTRFYGDDGFPGEAGFEFFDWEHSSDEDGLRRHIRIDVAANIAEMTQANCDPAGGYPSRFFDGRKPVPGEQVPSDVQGAWKCARQLAIVLFQRAGKPLDADELWKARRNIIEQAETEASQILQANLGALDRLADLLLRGPVTGAAVRTVVASG